MVGARRKRVDLHGVNQCVVKITVVIELEPFVSRVPDRVVRVLVVKLSGVGAWEIVAIDPFSWVGFFAGAQFTDALRPKTLSVAIFNWLCR